MTIKEFKKRLDTTGLPVAYQFFPETEIPKLPFIVFQELPTFNIKADEEVYKSVKVMQVNLFEKSRSETTENLIENTLRNWEKEIIFEETERLYRIIYKTSII